MVIHLQMYAYGKGYFGVLPCNLFCHVFIGQRYDRSHGNTPKSFSTLHNISEDDLIDDGPDILKAIEIVQGVLDIFSKQTDTPRAGALGD